MDKQVTLYFVNKKKIVATVDYNFRSLEEAKMAASYMCLGSSVIAHKKVGVIGVIPAEWMQTSYDTHITFDFYSWDVMSELTPDACKYQMTEFTERGRFFSLHPDVPPTSDKDKVLLKLYERKQAYQDAVIFFRHGDSYRAYLQDAYLLLSENPNWQRCWDDNLVYVSIGRSVFQECFSVLNKSHRIVMEDDCIIPEK